MIDIKDKKDCCGCSACVQKCPKQCISMKEDNEGFLYPTVYKENCIDCGLCEKVCPVINQNAPRKPLRVYTAKNRDQEIRMQSSSGGIFTLFAEKIIQEGGVVFGAKFNEHWEVVHAWTDTIEGIAAFRGSKYVQSYIGSTFREVETFLKNGRKVLFSGTPCQVVGLKRYLCKEYENLLTIDFVCHGVPSPGIFRWYLMEELQKVAHKSDKKYYFPLQSISSIPYADTFAKELGYNIEGICFRDKKIGWEKYSFTLNLSKTLIEGEKKTLSFSTSRYKNPFLKGFQLDLYLRPSCHHCPSKKFNSSSDITIGDFWRINEYMPEENDHKGHSLVFIHNQEFCSFLPDALWISDLDVDKICQQNIVIYKSSEAHINRQVFFASLKDTKKTLITMIHHFATMTMKKRIRLFIANLLK